MLPIYRDRIARAERGHGMPAARWRAGDVDPGLFDVIGCAAGVLGLARRAAWLMATAQRSGTAPGQRSCAGPKGPGFWGGSGGTWGGWWPGPQGPPGPPRGAKAGRGDVRAAILALLRDAPRTGYQIMSDIEECSGGAWRPSPGAVYPALSQLADEGLIVGEEANGRRTFSLTDAGREYVGQNPDMARGAWESTAQQEAWQPPGLLLEATRLGGGIMQIAHAGTSEQVRAAERLLEQTRRRLYQILADDQAGQDESQGEEHGNE
jgi:DNA-binding PadR family transcriptional regulator